MSDYARRISKLQEMLRATGVVAAVFGPTDQMRYLTGWAEPGHERFIGLFIPCEGDPAFLVPSINREQAVGNPAGIVEVVGWNDAEGWQSAAAALVQRRSLPVGNDVVLVDDDLASVHLLDLQSLFSGQRWLAAGTTMAGLREVKSAEELDSMHRAAMLIDTIYEASLGILRDGLTERELQDFFFDAFKRAGTRPSFTPLICFGPNGARPHHDSGAAALKRGDVVVIDVGCMWEGYCSDITRTVAFGEPDDPDAKRVYELVYRAHHAARLAATPGATGHDVDAAAREVITRDGYGPQFMHRTGHGIGLSEHEHPYIVAGNKAPLLPGMCFSIEPGIYLPGRFGVRIENIVTMTSAGARSLNAEPSAELRVVGD